MPRPAAITPNRHLHTTLPPDLARRLEDYLWSDSEGRVPRSAYQTFLVSRIQEFFSHREVDLSPYIGTLPGECIVQGSDGTVSHLINHLKTCKQV